MLYNEIMSEKFDKTLLNVKKEKGRVVAFDINRKFWGRASTASGSLLDVDTQLMCCLGFYGLACGLPKKRIANKCYLSDAELSERLKKEFAWLTNNASPISSDEIQLSNSLEVALAQINDSEVEYKRRDKKERLIKKFFANNGITV